MDLVTSPRQRTQAEQTSEVVVQHRLNILEPFQFGSALVVVEPTGEQHQTSHHQAADSGAEQLKL